MHTTADRLRTAPYRFSVGQIVRISNLAVEASVLERLRTARGREQYKIRLAGDDAGQPVRIMMGDGLVAA